MKQSDIDERVKELTTEAEMLGKQKRMLELLEECSKYGYEVELVDAHHPDLFDGPPYVTLRCKRSGVLMSNLESVREAAFEMHNRSDITERQYDIFNDAIWKLENKAKKMRRTSE
jgi:hypothetical protein